MRLNTKINRHERVAQVMLSGKPVSPEQFEEHFKGTDQEAVIYRLSTNIYNIRKDGGIIKVIKDGRKVTGYQLVNIDEFNSEGRFIGRKPKPVAVVKEQQILEAA
jgi:hypothetical protein